MNIKRRKLLALSAVLGATAVHPRLLLAGMMPTPAQSLGPFYPLELPLDSDNDLVRVSGQTGKAKGEISNLTGRVLDERGRPVREAQVEIWQCDANGRYRHPGDRGDSPRDPGFQGYGRIVTGDQGAYRFRTIKPVPYPGRAPHIHFAIRGPGFEPLVTQMYVRGAAQNRWDGILNSIRDDKDRKSLIVAFEPNTNAATKAVLQARFDIVLGTLQRIGNL
jgi:protocatechuate 3,4-dioxygenase beta subunit